MTDAWRGHGYSRHIWLDASHALPTSVLNNFKKIVKAIYEAFEKKPVFAISHVYEYTTPAFPPHTKSLPYACSFYAPRDPGWWTRASVPRTYDFCFLWDCVMIIALH